MFASYIKETDKIKLYTDFYAFIKLFNFYKLEIDNTYTHIGFNDIPEGLRNYWFKNLHQFLEDKLIFHSTENDIPSIRYLFSMDYPAAYSLGTHKYSSSFYLISHFIYKKEAGCENYCLQMFGKDYSINHFNLVERRERYTIIDTILADL